MRIARRPPPKKILQRLQAGESVAVVSDAGLPAICDPGADLVRLAIDADYILIPHKGSRSYTFGKLVGDYTFCDSNNDALWHSRSFEILLNDIPREAFSQSMRYSLGAYRTIFKVKDEEELLTAINRYRKQKKV